MQFLIYYDKSVHSTLRSNSLFALIYFRITFPDSEDWLPQTT